MNVVKKAPARPSQRRVALTVRLAQETVRNIEKTAAKTKTGARSFIREHLETTFGT